LFVFYFRGSKLQVIDLRNRSAATWPLSSQRPETPRWTKRAAVIDRDATPPEMIAMDSKTGKEVAHLPTTEGMDGVYFDAVRKRICISGGRGEDVGSVFVYQQKGPDSYEIAGKIPTRPGAGTSFWSPELNRYYVAAPAKRRRAGGDIGV